MRKLILIFALASGAAVLTPSSAEANWCLASRFTGTLCRFDSYNQCMASRVDRPDYCFQNPAAKAPPRPAAKPVTPPVKHAKPAQAPAQPATAVTPNALPPAKVPPPVAKKLDPKQFAQARKLILDGQYETGLAAMRALQFDEHPDVASFIGLAYRKLGQSNEAQSWYDKALAANPRHLQTLAYYGVLRAEQGDVEGARKDLERIRAVCGNTACSEYVGLSGVIAAKGQ